MKKVRFSLTSLDKKKDLEDYMEKNNISTSPCHEHLKLLIANRAEQEHTHDCRCSKNRQIMMEEMKKEWKSNT